MLQLLQPKTEGQKASQISMNHYIDLHLTHFLKHLHQKTTFSNDIITSVIFVSLLHEGLKSYANLKQSVRVIDQNIKFCVLFKLIPFCPSPPPHLSHPPHPHPLLFSNTTFLPLTFYVFQTLRKLEQLGYNNSRQPSIQQLITVHIYVCYKWSMKQMLAGDCWTDISLYNTNYCPLRMDQALFQEGKSLLVTAALVECSSIKVHKMNINHSNHLKCTAMSDIEEAAQSLNPSTGKDTSGKW